MASWDVLVQANGPTVADGAMGTMPMANGLEFGDPPEIWNLEHPEIIRRVQRAYADAGAEVLLTRADSCAPRRAARAVRASSADRANAANPIAATMSGASRPPSVSASSQPRICRRS